MAENHRLCFSYLERLLAIGKYTSKKTCGINRNHHQMSQKNDKTSGRIHNINTIMSQVIFRVVPVQIWAKTTISTLKSILT
jgi:hypothetical protein